MNPTDLSSVANDLLRSIGQPVPVAATARFVVREKFVVDCNGELPITYVGEGFVEQFFDLVEERVEAVALRKYRLLKASIDDPIIAGLGGAGSARIALAHLFEYLKSADRDAWYFFYVTDARGKLWAVDTYWRDGGWDLEAYTVTYPRGWRGGGHVVSR